MPQFSLSDYGVVGLVIMMFIVLIWKTPDILGAYKGAGKQTTNNDVVLQDLTIAITKLTVFLETEKAVDKEKEQVLAKNIENILEGVVDLQRSFAEHALRCDLSCKYTGERG